MPSHGSLSKAGKVRGRTPVNWSLRERDKQGVPRYHTKKHKCPRLGRRRSFNIWYNQTYVLPKLRRFAKVKTKKTW